MIKDRLIEVNLGEALALAGVGETVRCVGEGTGIIDLEDALEGFTFFVLEGKLTAMKNPEPVKIEASKDEIAKLTKSAFVPVKVQFDTPENRTRAIIGSVERYDEEHGEPAKQEAKPTAKREALAKEYGGEEEVPAPDPFAEAPTGGALK